MKDGETITLSAGEHSELIRAILEEFSPRFVPNGELIYVGKPNTGVRSQFPLM